MPVIRTRNAVLIIGTAFGLAAVGGSAGAQSYDQNPTRLAQMRGGFSGGGGANISGVGSQEDDKEKRRKEEERRKQEQAPPKGGAHGGSGGPSSPGGASGHDGGGHGGYLPQGRGAHPDSSGSGGGKRDERDSRPSRVIERETLPSQPSARDFRKKDEDLRRDRPDLRGNEPPKGNGAGGPFAKPSVQGQPTQFDPKKKDEDLHKGGRGGEKSLELPRAGAGAVTGKPPVQGQPTQFEPRKKDEDLHKGGRGGEKSQELPSAGAGVVTGKPPVQGQPNQFEPRKKDEDLRRGGHIGERGQEPPKGISAGEPSGKPSVQGQEPAGQHGGMFDKSNQSRGASGRPHMDSQPILPKPSQVELDTRRKERATFTRERLGDISKQRHERKDESGRVVLEEPGNRRIIREGGRAFIHHDESERLRRGARDFREERGPGGERRHYHTRPDGVVIISILGDDGRLIRRMRRERDGREVVFINNDRERWRRHRGHMIAGFGFSVDLAPPVIRIPHEEYYVDAENASEDDIYDALSAPPVDDTEADYTLDEIRYSRSLRDRLRRVNVSTINFEFGSWEVTEDQIGRLDVVAKAIRAILRRNADSVFLVGGHTDAVGSDEDNLSLSDRRAESVARVLTDEYGIPAENLTTQGYGEQQLLIETQGAERRNRRVEFQNITPLLARDKH